MEDLTLFQISVFLGCAGLTLRFLLRAVLDIYSQRHQMNIWTPVD
ncbi:MAG: hypothetical protein WBA92_04950 [Pseudorhodobacter sp.]